MSLVTYRAVSRPSKDHSKGLFSWFCLALVVTLATPNNFDHLDPSIKVSVFTTHEFMFPIKYIPHHQLKLLSHESLRYDWYPLYTFSPPQIVCFVIVVPLGIENISLSQYVHTQSIVRIWAHDTYIMSWCAHIASSLVLCIHEHMNIMISLWTTRLKWPYDPLCIGEG